MRTGSAEPHTAKKGTGAIFRGCGRIVPVPFLVAWLLGTLLLTACASRAADSPAEPLLKAGDTIVFFGDSITESPTGYVPIVAKVLAERFPEAGGKVINAGISGHRVPDLVARLEKDVIARMPDLVIVYIGINDVWASRKGKGTPQGEYRQGLMQILRALHNHKIRAVLCTPTVIGEKHDGTNPLDAMLEEYSAISRDVASRARVPLVDLRARFLETLRERNADNQEKGVLTYDGVHPNFAGNALIAAQLLGALGVMNPLPDAAALKRMEDHLNAIGAGIAAVRSAQARVRRVACVGDSITYGLGLADRARAAYPAVLAAKLGAEYEVRNFGVSGMTMLKEPESKYTQSYWKQPALQAALDWQPQIVVIMLGTNDVWHAENWALKDRFAADCRALVDRFAALKSKPAVCLCTPPPAFEERAALAANLQEAGEIIRAVAAEKKAALIDIHAALKDKPDLFPDKCHPDAEGARVIAEAVCQVLVRAGTAVQAAE